MSRKTISDDPGLEQIRETGLGPGVMLSEQRQDGGGLSAASRYGFAGRWLKQWLLRLLRFQWIRQAEFNSGTVRALREAEAQLRLLAGELARVTRQLVERDAEQSDRAERVQELVGRHAAELDRLSGVPEQLAGVAQLSDAVGELEADVQARSEVFDQARRRLGRQAKQIEEMEHRLTSVVKRSSKIEHLRKRVDAHHRDIAGLERHEQRLTQIDRMFTEQRVATGRLDTRIAKLQDSVGRFEPQQKALDDARSEADGEIARQAGQLEAHDQTLSALQTELEQVGQLAARLGTFERELGAIERQQRTLGKYGRALAQQKGSAERLHTRLSELRAVGQGLEARLEAREEAWTRTSERILGHTVQLDELRRSIIGEEGLRGALSRLQGVEERIDVLQPLPDQMAGLEDVATGLKRELDERRTELDAVATQAARVEELVGVAARLEEGLEGVVQQMGGIGEDFRGRIKDAFEEMAADAGGKIEQNVAAVQEQMGRIEGLDERLEKVDLALPVLAEDLEARVRGVAERIDPVLDLDYLRFERRFRGEESAIKERMTSYIGLFGQGSRVLDVGCGRGEFLVVAKENGVGAYGVDANSDMVSSCEVMGLDVIQGDALDHLASLDDHCLDGIFSAQVVEHFSKPDLLRFVDLCAAKLRRGGRLVLETVNVDTFSALRNFFTDPTHRSALPSRTLKFLVEAAGFDGVEVSLSSPLPPEAQLAPLSVDDGGEDVSPAVRKLVDVYNRNCALLNETLYAEQDYAIIAVR